MTRKERLARLKMMIQRLAQEADPKALADQAESGLESMPKVFAPPPSPQGSVDDAKEGVDKLLMDREDHVTDEEIDGLEAIVLKEGRPVVFIRKNGTYDDLPNPWTKLNDAKVRKPIQNLFPSIGRIDLPNSQQIPYGGTGFVVGDGLLMTNRHVGALFTTGLGTRGLIYTAGDAAVNFGHEVDADPNPGSTTLEVKQVVMIHPHWDMALLRVAGLPANARPLPLATVRPEELANRDVVAVGYPARDPRNDASVQDRIFGGKYNVKRFGPGKLRQRDSIRSFENKVLALTHDSSTLGGNSGSAVIDLTTGQVIGLHFAGVYLKSNYAVPTYELARDPRVVARGLNFIKPVPPATNDFDAAWARLGEERPGSGSPGQPNLQSPPPAGATAGVTVSVGAATWVIPIQVAISLGQPVSATVLPGTPAPTAGGAGEEAMQVPIIAPDVESREGYQPEFLDLPGGEKVPLPELTASGKRVVAKLDDGTWELRYHHFSVVMHKQRRLALFTASNVDWRRDSRTVDGRKPTRRQLTGLAENAREEWVTDPRISDGQQLPDLFFTKDGGAFDKGHIVRRDDVAWGADLEDMQKGNGDTYHTTNCSPQVAGFNRSARGEDNWGDLENLIQKETGSETVCIFAGPVLADDDRHFKGKDKRGPVTVQIPQAFWKIVVARGDDGPQTFGFVLEQDLSDVPLEVPLEFAVPQPWKRYMKSIAEIEGMLNGWVKLRWLKEHDALGTEEGRRISEGVRMSSP
jgi:endonuclease G